MPILEVPKTDSPLTQGDILKDVRLFETSDAWLDNVSKPANFKHCLVVSRPCVAAHKPRVVVVGVEKYKTDRPKLEKHTEIIDFLEGIRSGEKMPDCFYLGQIPGADPGRYRAKLDCFYTICRPANSTEMLAQRRLARLSGEFARDLHTRLFHAFASLGFDDHSWYSDEDLKWVLSAARKDLAEIRLAISAKEAEGATTEIAKVRQQLQESENRIAPLESELARRKLVI